MKMKMKSKTIKIVLEIVKLVATALLGYIGGSSDVASVLF